MMLNLLCYDSRLQTIQQRFALNYRQALSRGSTSFVRSIEPTSYWTGPPGTTSTNSLIVHFIPRD